MTHNDPRRGQGHLKSKHATDARPLYTLDIQANVFVCGFMTFRTREMTHSSDTVVAVVVVSDVPNELSIKNNGIFYCLSEKGLRSFVL